MTKTAALYQFFDSFGLVAYEENSVYSLETQPAFPYLTYEVSTDAFGDNDTAISVSLWYRSVSWAAANAKAEEISAAVGQTGVRIPIDGGVLLIRRGTPFAQNMGDEVDSAIKRKLLSFMLRFYTSN